MDQFQNLNVKSKEIQVLQLNEGTSLQLPQTDCTMEANTCTETTVGTNSDENYQTQITNTEIIEKYSNSLPILTFDHLKILTGSWSEFCFKKENKYNEVFLKGCKWSPDGTCLLTNCNDFKMRLFELPLLLYNCHQLSHFDFSELKPSIITKIGGLVYDFGWYPLMSSDNPDSCCFITTSSKTPVQLWDAYTGLLRCSYKGYNLQDEVEAALSVTFHPSGDFLLCGYKDNIKIFHTDIPGRDYFEIPTKGNCEQKGIVSCLAVNPSLPNIFAAGTYSKSIGLYDMNGQAVCLLEGQNGGLTQLMFSQDGSQLLSAGRKDPEILCRDLRQFDKVLWIAKRPHTTNQRIYMDLSVDNQHLLSGSSDGYVYVWDLKSLPHTETVAETKVLAPLTKWQAHNDCVNGLSVHRQIPVIATASGQRHVPEIMEDETDELLIAKRNPDKQEDSVKLWWAGNIVVLGS